MDLGLLADNLLSPPILFFVLGLCAGLLKSDLAIPEAVTKLLSLYLLWAIGLKGGVQIRAGTFTPEVAYSLGAAVVLAVVIPFYVFPLLKSRLGPDNAGAIAAVYGSVSAVTFLTATSYLNRLGQPFGGHMVAALALMESPAIIIALLLIRRSGTPAAPLAPRERPATSLPESLREAALNGPVVLLTGSMIIGAVIGDKGFALVKPLAADMFQGVLAFFLLELGLVAAKRSRTLKVVGPSMIAFAVVVPLINAAAGLALAYMLNLPRGDAFLLTVLAASASYIAAPAVARTAIPRASPGLYIPLALAITFPFNIAIGLPLYWLLVNRLWP
jgi:uncharacterized protein